MAINSAIHTFSKGMNMDVDYSLLPKDTYLYSENLRISSRDSNISGKSFALKNIKGHVDTTLTSSFPYSDERIVGSCVVRDWLVLFVNYNYTGSVPANSAIYKVQLLDNSMPDSSTFSVVIDDADTTDATLLNFGSLIKAVGRYESENIINVYWTDPDNNTRRINIAVYNTTDGLVHSVGNDYISVNELDFLLNAELYCPSFEEIVSGNLYSGVVFYSYQYYNLYGAETTFSPLSLKIHLTTASEAKTTDQYFGADGEELSGKGVKLGIPYAGYNTQDFDRLRLIRIHYQQANQLPTISIVKEINLSGKSGDTAVYVTDIGETLAEITLEEFSIWSNNLFKALEVTTKNDYILFGNIEEDVFDVDYDARAYRFHPTAVTGRYYARVFEESGNVYTIRDDGVWTQYSDYPTESAVVSSGTGWSIPETADCINRFNDLNNDLYDDPGDAPEFSDYPYAYDNTGIAFGGTGLNVTYEFVEGEQLIDSVPGTFFDTDTLLGDDPKSEYYYVSDSIATGNSYSSIWVDHNRVGYQRDEIYRFGVIFRDDKSRPSYVKWVGDIRFPHAYDESGTAVDMVSTDYSTETNAIPIGIRITIDNIPSGVSTFQIVRAIRKQEDKTVLSQGVISQVINHVDGNRYVTTCRLTSQYNYYTGSGSTHVDGVYNYVSPDINYGNYQYSDSDFLVLQYRLSGLSLDNITITGGNNKLTAKYQQLHGITKFKLDFTDFIITSTEPPGGLDTSTAYNLSGASQVYLHYVDDDDNANSIDGPAGTCATFSVATSSVLAALNWGDATKAADLVVANIKRINGAQYGGNTYNARLNTAYIGCSAVVPTTGAYSYEGVPIVVYGGDIYIGFFDHLRTIWHPDSIVFVAKGMSIAYLPLESTMNLTLTSGNEYNRNRLKPYSYATRESAGEHAALSDGTFDQEKDYYIYNFVYSTQPEVQLYYPENPDIATTSFDTRVVVSDRKINNEIVDSWTKFQPNNYIDVDTAYGSLNSLHNFKDKVFYLQDYGVGVISVNERSLITDESGAQLVLGTGGVLDRYDYVTTSSGTTSRLGSTITDIGLYWVDERALEFHLFNGEDNKLSILKGVNTLLKSYSSLSNNSLVIFDKEYKEVLFFVTITGNSTYNSPVVYSEVEGVFNGIYTYSPSVVVALPKGLLSADYNSSHSVYKHNGSTSYNLYYSSGASKSLLRLVCNESYPEIKTWDTVEYFSESISKAVTNNPNIYSNTFKYVRFYNDYQNTDYWRLTLGADTDRTANKLGLTRRERNFKFDIPRSSVNKASTTSPDIFLAANLNADVDFRERLRSNYLICEFIWGEMSGVWTSTAEFSVPFIKLNYRRSIR